MKRWDNGLLVEMTPEEIAAIPEEGTPEPTTDEKLTTMALQLNSATDILLETQYAAMLLSLG